MAVRVVYEGDSRPLERASSKASGAVAQVGDAVEKTGKRSKLANLHLGELSRVIGGAVIAHGLIQLPGLMNGIVGKARDLELQMKKATIVFGEEGIKEVEAWADSVAHSLGLTRSQAINAAAGLQDLLIPMGFTRDAATEMSTKTIELSGALAEWSGGARSSAEVAEILQKAYLGETESLKGLGIAISAAEITGRLMAKGQEKLTGNALAQAKAIAIQELIFEKSTDAQKAFADGSGSAARKQAELSARMAEAKERLAQAFAPAVTQVTTLLAQAAVPIFEKLTDVLAGLGGTIARVSPYVQTFARVFSEDVVPAMTAIWRGEILGYVEAFRDAILVIGPAMADWGRAAGEVLWPALQKVIGFLNDHKEIYAAVAIAIGTLLVAAFTAWAISATAAAIATIAATLPIAALIAALSLLALGIIYVVKNWDDINEKYPQIAATTAALREAMDKFVGWIKDPFLPTLVKIGNTIADTAKFAYDKFNEYFPPIWDNVIKPALDLIWGAVQLTMSNIQTKIDTVLGVIHGIFLTFKGLFTGDWDLMWQGVKEIVGSVFEGIKTMFTDFLDWIHPGLGQTLLKAGHYVGDMLVAGMKTAFKYGINEVIAIFEAGINLQLELVAKGIKALKKLLDAVPGANPFGDALNEAISALENGVHIRRLASGGIVTGSTLANIGEEGAEAVIPLEQSGWGQVPTALEYIRDMISYLITDGASPLMQCAKYLAQIADAGIVVTGGNGGTTTAFGASASMIPTGSGANEQYLGGRVGMDILAHHLKDISGNTGTVSRAVLDDGSLTFPIRELVRLMQENNRYQTAIARGLDRLASEFGLHGIIDAIEREQHKAFAPGATAA